MVIPLWKELNEKVEKYYQQDRYSEAINAAREPLKKVKYEL